MSLLAKRNHAQVQSLCLLEPLPLVGFECRAPIEVGQSPPNVGDPPVLVVRLSLADREHLREGLPSRRPVVAQLVQSGHHFKRADHLLVQSAAASIAGAGRRT
jgi:hypothetical protein